MGCQASLTPCFPPASGLVQELLQLLGTSRRLSRAALHLLLLPHLRQLSLRPCPALANNALGHLIVLRCQVGRGDWGWGCPSAVGVGERDRGAMVSGSGAGSDSCGVRGAHPPWGRRSRARGGNTGGAGLGATTL